MLCQKCGADVRERSRFCDNCGISLEEYPPVSGGAAEGEEVRKQLIRKKIRNRLIITFVAFDVMLAAFLIYFFSRYSY